MHSSITIANCFLDLAERDGESLTPMKIQKLVHIAHGWHLGLFREPLVSEPVEAWDFGPVFPSIYHEFKKYGGGSITGKGREKTGVFSQEILREKNEFIDAVWKIYHQYTGIQLANLTHESNSPWDMTTKFYREQNYGQVPHNVVIENQTIQNYYEKLANQSRENDSA